MSNFRDVILANDRRAFINIENILCLTTTEAFGEIDYIAEMVGGRVIKLDAGSYNKLTGYQGQGVMA